MSAHCYYPIQIITGLLASDNLSRECFNILKTEVIRSNSTFIFYFLIFSLTCLTEAPFYVSAGYFKIGNIPKRSVPELLKQTIFLNLATHPIVYWVFPYILEKFHQNILTYVSMAEIFALVVEALLLKYFYKYSWKASFATSICANIFSWSFGVWLQVMNYI